jgi:hypothetical protein
MDKQQPTHIAYVVNENKKRATDPKAKDFWRPVGVVWPHKSGEGFDVVIYDQISVGGRIVCTVPRDEEDTPAE